MSADEIKKTPDAEAAAEPEKTVAAAGKAETTEHKPAAKKPAAKKPAVKKPASPRPGKTA